MRIVVDTNVLISALLKPGSVPDRTLGAIAQRGVVVLYDARIEAEYREVLSRPKFRAIPRSRIDDVLERLVSCGEQLIDVPPWTGSMPDEDDRAFVEVALAGSAYAIVTGNLKDYPADLAVAVLPPATLLAELESRP